MAGLPNPFNVAWDAIRSAKGAILTALIGVVGVDVVVQLVKDGRIDLGGSNDPVRQAIDFAFANVEEEIGAPLFELLVTTPTGVALSGEAGAQEANAVRMVQRLLGFAVLLPSGIGRVKAAMEVVLGENAPKGFLESLEKIPEDIGINWALGNMLDSILEVAAKQPIEEAIARQTRPARMEWPQIRALARQHVMSDEQMVESFQSLGFRDQDIEFLRKVDRTLLSVSDLQGATLYGMMSDDQVMAYLDILGFSPEDANIVRQLYVDKAETAGGNQLRAVAQRGYLDNHLTEDQYRSILAQSNVPPRSIDLEVEAASLVKAWQSKTLSIAAIKELYLNAVLSDADARTRLMNEGYSEGDANLLIQEWQITKKSARSGFTENRILAYLVGGLLEPAEAYSRLLSLGINPQDASFLVQHPQAVKQVKPFQLSDAAIVSAMIDGVLTQDQAAQKLADRGVDAESARILIQSALAKVRKGPKPKKAHKDITEATVLEAFKLGLASDTWAVRELETLGYSEADAGLLVAVEEAKLGGRPPAGWQTLV